LNKLLQLGECRSASKLPKLTIEPGSMATTITTTTTDTDTRKPPFHEQAIQLALDVANGRHFLSRLIPPALLLADALLCALVIWKVPCKPSRFTPSQLRALYMG